jgi:hypothetical protein
MLHASGCHAGTICMRLAASTMQSRQFFESTVPEQLFELQNEETIKKI